MSDVQRAFEHYRAMAVADAEYPVNNDLAKYRRTAIQALEKQMPQEVITIHPIKKDVKVGNITFRAGCKLAKCPVCGEFLSNDTYCRYCGQRLTKKEAVK